MVVKCRTHWCPGQTRRHRIDARRFPDTTTARAQVEMIIECGGEPVLQRPVEGSLGALIGLYHGGRLHGRVQQRTSRLWPTPQGMSARARTVPVDPALTERAEALLHRIGWRGLVELQFLTGADRIPHLIDLNGRFYGSLALADQACPGLRAQHSVWDSRDPGPTWQLIRERLTPRAAGPDSASTEQRTARARTAA
ncbi:MAG: hypothetical protein H0U62_02225 [Actinobacteria bacterium]|nr:hypothetical protein [Actinomycetota bacterium]